jgi:predicted alpha/beta superfamily hydrolase
MIRFRLLIMALWLPLMLPAQNIGHSEISFQSEVFKGERTLKIFLPERYERDTSQRFLQVYLLDAQDEQLWNMVTGNIDYLVSRYCVIPMMIVGIVSNHRGKEFNPKNSELTDHFKKEVFEKIEKEFRVLPHKTLIGHSWGGAFVGNTLFGENKDMFDAYLGLSPSFGAIDGRIFNQAEKMVNDNSTFRKFFYFSSGTVGMEKEYKSNVLKMDSIIKAGSSQNLIWQPATFENMDHFSALSPGICEGLVAMSRCYFADQKMMEDFVEYGAGSLVNEIDAFYQQQESWLGFIYKEGPGYYTRIGEHFREEEKLELAIEMFKYALEIDENHVKAWAGLADCFDALGNTKLAKSAFTKLLELLEVQKEKVSEAYYRDVSKWAREKLSSY